MNKIQLVIYSFDFSHESNLLTLQRIFTTWIIQQFFIYNVHFQSHNFTKIHYIMNYSYKIDISNRLSRLRVFFVNTHQIRFLCKYTKLRIQIFNRSKMYFIHKEDPKYPQYLQWPQRFCHPWNSYAYSVALFYYTMMKCTNFWCDDETINHRCRLDDDLSLCQRTKRDEHLRDTIPVLSSIGDSNLKCV